MKEEIRQYYETLVDKDSDGTKYFFQVIAENTASGMRLTLASPQQNPKKCRGAENFKSYVDKAERGKYDMLYVNEYGADGVTVINPLKFKLGKRNNKPKYPSKIPTIMPGGLQGFEQQLGVLGFQDGLAGVIAASAEKMSNEDRLRRQDSEIIELKNKNSILEQKCEGFKKEAEDYRDQCKSLKDDIKMLKRDHKNDIQDLKKKYSVTSIAVQGIIGVAAKNPKVSSFLNGLIAPETDDSDDDDETEEEESSTMPSTTSLVSGQAQQYLNAINAYINQCGPVDIEKVATIFQYITIPGKLDELVQHCRDNYKNS